MMRYGIAGLYVVALAILSLMSAKKAQQISPMDFLGGDKVAHLVAYALLSFLVMYALNRNLEKKNWIWIMLACIIYGIILECLQYVFFTGRHFEILDIIANIIGCILGILVFNKLNKK